MSLHRSLKTTSSALQAHRNVLTRAERIIKLQEDDRFSVEDDAPIHLPKVRNIKIQTKKKKAAKAEEETTEEETPTEE